MTRPHHLPFSSSAASRVRIHGLIFPLSEKRLCVSPLPVAYAFSHSQDLIPGEFAWSDFGQNYKNLAFLAAGLGWDPPTVAFGCGHR